MQFPFLYKGKLRLRELKWHSKVIWRVSGSRRVSCMTCALKTHSWGHFLFFSPSGFCICFMFTSIPDFLLFPGLSSCNFFTLSPTFPSITSQGVSLLPGTLRAKGCSSEQEWLQGRQVTLLSSLLEAGSTAGAFVFMACRELWDASHPVEARVLFHALFKVILKTTLKNEEPKGL